MSAYPLDAFGRQMHGLNTRYAMLGGGAGALPQHVVEINGQLFTVAGASSVLLRLTDLIQEADRRNDEEHNARLPEGWAP